MRKMYKITMGILYATIGLLALLTLVILFYDKLDFLHSPKIADSFNEAAFAEDDYDTLTFPISAVKSMDLVYRFADPYTNKRYEYGEVADVDGMQYHVIYSSSARPLMVGLQTGDIFVYDGTEGLIPLADVIPEMIDHRKHTGSDEYAEGYKVFHYYMRALIDKGDRKSANSLKDTSHFEKGVPEEKKEAFQKIVMTTESCQETILALVETMEQRKKSGEISDYVIGYQISSMDEYVDEEEKWTDIYVELKAFYEQNGYIDIAGEYYRISVKEYGKKWKVARISES